MPVHHGHACHPALSRQFSPLQGQIGEKPKLQASATYDYDSDMHLERDTQSEKAWQKPRPAYTAGDQWPRSRLSCVILRIPLTFLISSEADVKHFIKDEAWGHHASCSAPIGADDDVNAVLDTNFKVRGVQGLRVVDASAFAKIPGTFIALPTYMISEKAADVIIKGL
ncbi:hypothetical protein LTR78_003151 [Recurvomyces mirabilis]|uniref:Glucose-methanol-choline oxidoreductase C-terminal domain-containing protein n=1 Tax=Recurvomyces mirabilis TaxID=574656 RepID=A0AAE0WRY6_9PEZI|nr:hypothetical protein LTR78_003151 [Recurvomyces mirabilis]